MVQKKAFVLRLDPDKMEMIEKWAADEFRSANGQIEWIIDRALKEAHRYPARKEDKEEESSKNPGL
jgi:hypothetical protein